MSLPELPARGRRLCCAVITGWLLLSLAIPAGASIELRQADGSSLVIEEPAERIITLSPHLAELAFAAGAGDRLLATVEYSDYPESAARLPRIGDAFRFDLERILAFRPDLVIAWGSGNPAPALARLEDLGLRVWRIEILSPDDIPQAISDMARSAGLGEPEAALRAKERLVRLRESFSDRSVWSYFYQVSQQPLFTLNGSHLVSQGLALCGGRNVFAQEPVIAPQVSLESVLQADPDVLIAPTGAGFDNPLEHWRAWPVLTAVRQQNMLLLPADEISRATPRALSALLLACEQVGEMTMNETKDSPS